MISLPSAKFVFKPQSVAAFDPASLSGLVHRFLASDAATGLSSGFVTAWTDSATGVNLEQTTSARRPRYIASAYDFNNQPVVRFSAGHVMASTALSSIYANLDRTVFVIAKTNATGDATYGDNLFATDDAPIANYNANSWPYYLPKAVSTRGIHAWASTSSFYGEQATSKPMAIVWRQNSSAITFRREKTTLISTTLGFSGNQGYVVVGKGMQNTGHDADCDIAEVLVYNRALSDAEITQVEDYAYAKYNLGSYGTLPVTGAALWLDASRLDSLYAESTLVTPVTADNGSVGAWMDLTSNARHAVQSGTNRPTWRRPVNGQNGLGVLSFNGSSQWLDISSLPALDTGYTFYGVFKQPSANGYVFCAPGAGTANSTAAITAQPSAAVTAVGNAQISTSSPQYGTGSATFDGTTNTALSIDGSTGKFAFGTSPFTVEFWLYPTSLTARQGVYSNNLNSSSGSGTGLVFAIRGAGTTGVLGVGNVGAADTVQTGANAITANAWQHVALVREGTGTNQSKIYVNGVLVATGTLSDNYSTSRDAAIGRTIYYSEYFQGKIDDFRISKFAAYTSAFTPPAGPHPDDGSASLMLHMDGTNGSTTFTDSSSRAGLTQGNADVSSPAPVAAPVGFVGNYNGGHTTGSYSIRTSLGTSYKAGTMTQAIGTPAAGAARVGRATGTATQYFNSSLYELVVLPRQSTTTEDDAWKTYTAAKWGITWS